MPKTVKVVGNVKLIDVTPTVATDAYTSGDLLFAETQVPGAVRYASGYGEIWSITIIDKDDQGAAMDLYFFNDTVTAGTVNSAPSISDADAAKCLGFVEVADTDYNDVGGSKLAYIKPQNIAPIVQGNSSGDIYMAAITGGTPTHTVGGLVLRVGVFQE